ncbi:MAG: substrate-binding domain-containing protein [Planctomycetia bacterium]|nr:substrate-binding domain-containing protein [Planctomycetia bacterium]
MNLSRCWLLALLALLPASGCSSDTKPAKQQASAAATITLQTTTSPRDSGLLDYLLPKFREQSGIDVKVVAVGSGQALENSRRGDGDVIISHSPEAEQKFMDDGFGVSRRPLMENDFIIVGPATDPAKVKGLKSAAEAVRTISEAKAPFVSRSDESGTHVKEKSFWKSAKVEPSGDWYVRAGLGMADALRMADEKQAYTLTDRGTYLALREKLKNVPLVEGDPALINRYSVIVVSAAKHPGLHQPEATKFADFLLTPETKKRIGEFGREKFGESLFRPAP